MLAKGYLGIMLPAKNGTKASGWAIFTAIACWIGIVSLFTVPEQTLRADDLEDGRALPDGIHFLDEQSVPIPLPSLHAMAGDQYEPTLREIAGKIGWERFAKNNLYAPVIIDIDSIKRPNGDRIAHSVHSGFIAYSTISQLRDEDLMQSVLGRQDKSLQKDPTQFGQLVPESVLQAKGIQPHSPDESYAYVKLPLMNRVLVEGVIRTEKREGEHWVEMYWEFDPRFLWFPGEPLEFSNFWRPVSADAVGRPTEQPPQPYLGCGGFLAVYEIDTPNRQLFVESRLILHEPHEWFNGSQFLRSKLPTMLQENARKFRRELKP
ncbi:MAG: hypothetical protein KDB22_21950 [Planctomycetales bacterium]|nr:hypothetical protein [Planctomycetales bacterium]